MAQRKRGGTAFLVVLAAACLTGATARAQGIEQPRIPLRTALNEINIFRSEYAEAYNKKDAQALAAMYSQDAIVIQGNGTVNVGRPDIGRALAADAPNWQTTTFTATSTRVVGHTAWESGTLTANAAGGAPMVMHYLVVLRRGLKDWLLASVAVVPENAGAGAGH